MRILLTNAWMVGYGGTESWIVNMAKRLIDLGHIVSLYTPIPGKVLDHVKKLGVTIVSSGEFDLILDNHQAVKRGFFSGFVIHTCHGIIPVESPMCGVTNVAVSKKVADNWKIDSIIPNGIDTIRFSSKKPVNEKINMLLSLCKSDSANRILAEICTSHKIKFRSMYGHEVFNIEDKINEADLVVGVGRSLLDAMACGRPVVSFDDRNYYSTRMMGHGYITPDKFKFQQIDNFTASSIGTSLSKADLEREIFEKYNPKDGEVNRQFIIENLSIEKAVDRYLEIYNSSDHSKTFVSKPASSVKIDSNKYYGWT